jgi:hypothetical protein
VDSQTEKKKYNLQLKIATTKPTELPAVRRLGLFNMYPHANRIRSRSRNAKSKNKTQEDLIAAIVNIIVKINQAHMYMASAWGNCAFSSPVVASVYDARIPDPGR